jgi:nucleoside-diphosphate-sugar epimerase
MKKRIFITGASSFLGKELVEKLSESYDITVLEHNKNLNIPREKNIKIVYGGLENVNDWENNLLGVNIIIHLAAITHTRDIPLYKKINTDGTIDLINASKRQGVNQFIFISTRAIGKCCGNYGFSKEAAEDYIGKSGLIYTILRVGEAYDDNFGGKEGLNSLANLIKKIFIVPVPSANDITLAPIHKDDVRDGIVAAINNPTAYSKTYILAGPESLSMKEVATRMAKHFKFKRLFIPIPTFLIKFIFFIFSNIFGIATPDQLDRLLCKKEPLSENVLSDLKIKPRYFLS